MFCCGGGGGGDKRCASILSVCCTNFDYRVFGTLILHHDFYDWINLLIILPTF